MIENDHFKFVNKKLNSKLKLKYLKEIIK